MLKVYNEVVMKRLAGMICCTLFFEYVDILFLKVWQWHHILCVICSMTQHEFYGGIVTITVTFNTMKCYVCRMSTILWNVMFAECQYFFMFSSNCLCVYSFGHQSPLIIERNISTAPTQRKCWSSPSAISLWRVAYRFWGSWWCFFWYTLKSRDMLCVTCVTYVTWVAMWNILFNIASCRI
jgi:hypothetical protein